MVFCTDNESVSPISLKHFHMNAPSTPDSHESNAANPAIEGGTVSPVSVGEKHCVAVARAMEERKGLLTRESVQVSAVGDLDGSMSQCVALSERE